MRILKRMTDCLLVMLLLAVAVVSAPQALGFQVYTVLSGSMMPQIPVGSAVYVKKEAFANISAGDVVTYHSDVSGVYVTHRVVEKNEEGKFLVMKGDANEEPDGSRVHEEELIGVVRFFVPYLGYAAALLGGTGEKLLLLGTFLWLLLIRMVLTDVLKIHKKEVTMQ